MAIEKKLTRKIFIIGKKPDENEDKIFTEKTGNFNDIKSLFKLLIQHDK